MTAATPGLQSDLSRRVLVVDDDSGMRMALEMCFSQRGWQVESASGKKEALTRFCRTRHSLVVSDIRMPDGNGLEIMRAAKEIRPATAVILLTAFGCVPDAVAAMKAGACEYLTKPVTFEQLLDRAEELVTRSTKQSESGDRISGARIVGSSGALLKAMDDAERAAQSNADILIEAESGTGKELLARMIHEHGARHDGPFVAVNCAALPESLLESELFGHGRGAFTGAFASQAGKFEAANRGTLLLDEIGELPLSLQPKLLRVLEEREFYRLGELRRVKLDVRVIASTNRRLAAMVKQGTFRADLYYRLNVIPLTLPPLRERRKDVRELAGYFAQRFAPDGLPVNFSDSFLLDLEQYAWPGNVRELANTVRRMIALGREPSPFEGCDPPVYEETSRRLLVLPKPVATNAQFEVGMSLQTVERCLLEMTLTATSGNRSRAAEMLGISLRTVRNKIREYNLPPRRAYASFHD